MNRVYMLVRLASAKWATKKRDRQGSE